MPDNAISLSNILTVAITSGLVAGVITTIGNIIIAILGKNSNAKLEKEKYKNSINDYQYKELHGYLRSIVNLPVKTYYVDSKEKVLTLVQQSNEEYQIVYSYYLRAIPLIDKDLIVPLESMIEKIDSTARQLSTRAFDKKQKECYLVEDEQSQVSWDEIVTERDKFTNELVKAIQTQLGRLFNRNDKQAK